LAICRILLKYLIAGAQSGRHAYSVRAVSYNGVGPNRSHRFVLLSLLDMSMAPKVFWSVRRRKGRAESPNELSYAYFVVGTC